MSDRILGLLCLVVASALASVVIQYIELPVVQESAATGKCVKVIFYDGSLGSCENLPEKYIHEYVR